MSERFVTRGAIISDQEGMEHRLAIRTASARQREVPDAPQAVAVAEQDVLPVVEAVAVQGVPPVVEAVVVEPDAPQAEAVAEQDVPPLVEAEAVLESDAPQVVVVAAEPDAQRQEAVVAAEPDAQRQEAVVVAQPGASRQAEKAAELTWEAGRAGWSAARVKFERAVVGLQACQ